MKCYNCGADLTDDTVFCSYCGVKLESDTDSISQHSDENIVSDENIQTSNNQQNNESNIKNTEIKRDQSTAQNEESYVNIGKAFISNFWHSLDLFCKIAAISIIVAALLLLVSVGTGKGLPIFLSIVQLAGIISALLIHKDSIKLNNKWVKYIVLGVSILLTISTLMSFSSGTKNTNNVTEKANTNTNQTEEQVIVPVNSPYGYDDCIDKDYSAIKTDFELSGFTNISTESVEDLNYSESDKLYTIESISINGNTDFTKDQEFEIDDKVIIRYHEYRPCNVKINIEFTGNWIFNKYDVNVLLDDDKLDTLSHGTDNTLDFSVVPGEHIISFVSTDSSTVKGEMSLTIDCDLEAAYKIYCNTDDISVESLYIDRFTELSENEVKMDKPVSDYLYKNYKEAEDSLKTLGFTNIEFNVLYDIVFGLTTEGSVDSVSIDGNNDFKRGDVFSKDAHIIITYHMKEEDDPNKQKDNEISEAMNNDDIQDDDLAQEKLTIVNCPELAAILSNKSEYDESYADFATKYKGRIIEFDGRIDYCVQHGDYKTRFDYLVSAGDYDPDHQIGPTFKFEDVAYHNLNTDLDTVSVGMNVHIIAEVESFDSNSLLFYLNPVSVTGR